MEKMKQKEYETEYGKIRYIDYNESNKTTIFYIHGLGCCGTSDYSKIAENENLKNYRHIVIDLLGSGISDKPLNFDYTLKNHSQLLANLIADIGLDEIVLYGHSMGGTIAILLADYLKNKVKAIILSEANLDNGGGIFSREIANNSLEYFCNRQYDLIIEENIKKGNKKWSDSLSKTLPKAVYQEAVSLVNGQNKSWRQIFYELPCSKTFIFGEYSLPDDDFDILRNNNINIKVINKAGHSMAWENPTGLAKTLYEIIK